jgi:ribosomal protein S18 acetylase RimI-like enzyme
MPAFGSTAANVLRLAVDRNYRRKGVGRKLAKALNALVFKEKEDGKGGFGATQSRASVILNVHGYGDAQDLFWKEGYRRGAEIEGSTYSWSNKLERIVRRSSQPMFLGRNWYGRNRLREQERNFPKERPVQLA